MSHLDFEEFVPAADTDALGLGVGRRSIGRRIKTPPPGFPTPIRLNGRLYFRRSEVEAYKQRLIAEALATPGSRATKAA